MKKFQLTITIGELVVYQSIISFTEAQEKEFLETVDQIENLNMELDELTPETAADPLADLIAKDPDVVIRAGLMAQGYGLFQSSSFFDKISGLPATVNLVSSQLEQYSWECTRIE